MNITIDAATASVITALIVGLVSILTTIIANSYSFKQNQIQFEREEKRAEREERRLENKNELERKKAIIGQLQEICGNSISSLTTLLIYDDSSKQSKPEYAENIREVQKWLSLVISYHYDKSSDKYKTFISLYNESLSNIKGFENSKKLRELMIDFAANDPRLNP